MPPTDTEQLWAELLAYCGGPLSEDDPGVMPWIQDVLYVLSEKYPHSSLDSRLDMMVQFSDWCLKEKRK